MGHQFVCRACGRRLTVPDELFANKIRGRVVTVKCKGCGASIGIDGTIPPPPIEPNDTSSSGAPGQGSRVPSDELGQSEPALSLAPERKAEPGAPISPRPDGTPASSTPFVLSRRSSRPPPADTATEKAPTSSSKGGTLASKVGSAVRKTTSQPPRPTQTTTSSKPPRPTSSKPAGPATPRASEEPAPSSRKSVQPPTVAARKAAAATPKITEEPEIKTEPTENDWETDSPSESAQRFSHVDGPIPVRHPTARIGRYALFDQFAEGGIATVHFGRLDGAGGFSRVVAIKRLLPHLVTNEEFTEMLLKEARFAARVRHPNVVPTLDVVASQGDVLLILEYIHGESLSGLARKQAKSRKDHIPVEIAAAIMLDVLSGLSAVHEATDEKGRPLLLVHRDISPPNIVVGADGYARVLDFGIAKALEQIEESMPTRLKGKIGYMAPEQIRGEGVSQRSDVFAAGVILWELLATRRMFTNGSETDRMKEIVAGNYPNIGQFRASIPKALEEVTMRALSVDPAKRFENAREFADALEHASPRASARRVSEWVRDVASGILAERDRMIAQVENWNVGKEIPLHSSAFAAEAVQAFETLRPPPAAPAPAEALAERADATQQDSKSSRGSLLLIASCVILLLALYFTVWK